MYYTPHIIQSLLDGYTILGNHSTKKCSENKQEYSFREGINVYAF